MCALAECTKYCVLYLAWWWSCEPKHVAEFLILITDICCVIDWNYCGTRRIRSSVTPHSAVSTSYLPGSLPHILVRSISVRIANGMLPQSACNLTVVKWNTNLMQHCAGFISAGSLYHLGWGHNVLTGDTAWRLMKPYACRMQTGH